MKNFQIRLISTLAFVALTACGKPSGKRDGDHSQPPSGRLTPSPQASPEPTPVGLPASRAAPELNLKGNVVIREFGGKDTAALFIIRPATGDKIDFTEIWGPGFLGTVYAGVLSTTTMSKLFNKSAIPLPGSERQKLVTDFNGASFIYFESYDGQLCNGDEQTISAYATIQSRKISVMFRIIASPVPSGNCFLQESGIGWGE